MSARYFEACGHAKIYAQFRPSPPPHLIKIVIEYVNKMFGGNLKLALDVGCGSGQSTCGLASYFNDVIGLDISEAQINEATKLNTLHNVKYMVSPAEKLSFESNSFQLITAGQSCHWFDMTTFFNEADRILSPGGVLAMYSYEFPRPIWGSKSDKLFQIVNNMYHNHTAKYFGKERKYVDERLRDPKFTIPYSDFHRVENICLNKTVTVKEFQGYIRSWSGFQGYRKDVGEEESEKLIEIFLADIMETLEVTTTPEETKMVISHPFVCLLGSKPK